MKKRKHRTEAPTIFISFGITGDLMTRKVIPALWHLSDTHQLPKKFALLGISRRPLSDTAFKTHLRSLSPSVVRDSQPPLLQNTTYVAGDVRTKELYVQLDETIRAVERMWGMCANKIFYLAVSPELYAPVLKRLTAAGLTQPCNRENGAVQILIEKPFGHDGCSAARLDTLLAQGFDEKDIYRIDHYLEKGVLRDAVRLRFSHPSLHALRDIKNISAIHITLLEQLGVERRGAFYDTVGAFRDVGQNHMLEMLALLMSTPPRSQTTKSIRKARMEALSHLVPLSPSQITHATVRGQYQRFKDIPGVRKNSDTETYFKITCTYTRRGTKIPVILEGGKGMGETRKEMVITFSPSRTAPSQKLVISLEPTEGITLSTDTRTGLKKQKKLRAPKRAGNIYHHPVGYSTLLLDCISRNQTSFVHRDEVRLAWRFTDPIIRAWKKGLVPLEIYK